MEVKLVTRGDHMVVQSNGSRQSPREPKTNHDRHFNWWSMAILISISIYMLTLFLSGFWRIKDLGKTENEPFSVLRALASLLSLVFYEITILGYLAVLGKFIFSEKMKFISSLYAVLLIFLCGIGSNIIDYSLEIPIDFWFKLMPLTLHSLFACVFWQALMALITCFLFSRVDSSYWEKLFPIYYMEREEE